MKAIRVHAPGPAAVLQFEEIDDPTPLAHEVLIRVRAVGINPVETYIRSGRYAHLPNCPYIPGSDAAGTVMQIGNAVTSRAIGDRVYLMGSGLGLGAYAEWIAWPADKTGRIPDSISFEQAAAINIPYATAHRALHERGAVRGGDVVLIHGGSGGVGIAAVQLAAAAGARVFATAGTERGVELTRMNGAVHAFNHATPGYVDDIKRHVPEGFDLIIENLANVNLDVDLELIRTFGRVVVVGSRGRIEVDPRRILQKDAVVSGMALWNASDEDIQRIHAALYAGFASGALRPVVGRTFPLEQACMAHDAVLAPGAYGKIVLQA